MRERGKATKLTALANCVANNRLVNLVVITHEPSRPPPAHITTTWDQKCRRSEADLVCDEQICKTAFLQI